MKKNIVLYDSCYLFLILIKQLIQSEKFTSMILFSSKNIYFYLGLPLDLDSKVLKYSIPIWSSKVV